MPLKRVFLIAGIAIAAFVLDRFTKTWVERSIPLYDGRRIVGDWVRIVHTENTGAAFGLLPERTTILSILSVFAVFAILYYYRQIASSSPLVAATLGLQLGGAFGNLWDRVTQGYVVDFIDVGIPNGWRFWAFNVADSSIVIGILLVSFLLWLEERKQVAHAA